MNETNLKILNAIPLTEVMQGWGYSPHHETKSGSMAVYICPWHDDHHPSLTVDKQLRDGAEDFGFKCWACGQEGYGAIQLAARLMGMPAGKVPAEDLPQVLDELMTRCDVELEPEEDGKPVYNKRVSIVGWNEFHQTELQYADWNGEQPILEAGEWTEACLKAMGVKIELASHRAKKSDIGQGATDQNATAVLPLGATPAEIKIGDIVIEYDADNGEPLYRCSLDKNFYRDPKKAKACTIREWGGELERMFRVKPVARFILRVEPGNGGAVARIVRATRNYPILMFSYPWGTKKYEPRAVSGSAKWTWWNKSEDADLYHQWYGDAVLEDYLRDGVLPTPDDRHPLAEKGEEGSDGKGRPRFRRVVLCSGPRDAIAVWSHSDAHVVWLHSEQAGFDHNGASIRPNRWLRSLLRKLQNITAEGGLYVCYDEDDTGLAASQAIALNSPTIHWLRLPKELGMIREKRKAKSARQPVHSKPLKDVTDFVTRFAEVERLMPADLQHDDPCDWFDNALFDTPTTQFWQWESERKEKDGTGRARYKFDLRNTPVFLRARGMVRKVVQQDSDTFSRFFFMGNDHIYSELYPGEKGANKLVPQVRDLMAEWLRAHREYNDEKGALSRAIYSAKLETGTLEAIETMDFDDRSYGEDFDHFFFKNTAVKVTKDKIETVSYSTMKWWTNRDAILDGNFELVRQEWRVIVSPFYAAELAKHEDMMRVLKTEDERKQENMRWDAWASLWKYQLVMDKPIDEMPLHFRFLYNTSRIFWEKELNGEELTKTEKQMQDMYFIAKLHALGSAMIRHRSANRQQFIHITDNGTRREDLASGGTGKTAILELVGLMRRVLKIDGKALEGSNIILEQELGKVVPGIHNVVCIDELPQGFSPRKMYNVTLSITSRGLYKGSIKLEGDDLPKFVVASNEQLDLSSDSTFRRTYQLLVGDWYHPRSMDGARTAHTPADDFRKEYGIKEVARNLPQHLLNQARNFLLGCAQLFFQLPDETLRPPRDNRALLRQALAASKDEQFTMWISGYLDDKRHLGIPIAYNELCISLLDYCGTVVGEKTIKAAQARIRNNLEDYLKTSVYVCNPDVVLKTETDKENRFRRCFAWQHQMNADGSIKTDKHGKRLPRVLIKKSPYPKTYYFYRKGTVPRYEYDDAHIGDPDYVQPAPDIDPETETINE